MTHLFYWNLIKEKFSFPPLEKKQMLSFVDFPIITEISGTDSLHQEMFPECLITQFYFLGVFVHNWWSDPRFLFCRNKGTHKFQSYNHLLLLGKVLCKCKENRVPTPPPKNDKNINMFYSCRHFILLKRKVVS